MENIIAPLKEGTIKDTLFKLATLDEGEQRKTFIDIMEHYNNRNNMFALMEGQLKALIEIIGAI